MAKELKEGQIVRRLAACPAYDIAGTENWLSDLAEEGLFLTEDGFFGDVAKFEVKPPRKAKYRLEAVQYTYDDTPDEEQIELSREYSWEYVCKRGSFFVFRSFDTSARELNTDPEVQALTLNTVKKKQRDALIWSVFFLFIYPLLLTKGCILLSAIALGSVWMTAAVIFGIWSVIENAKSYFYLKKFQTQLRDTGCYTAENDWRKNKRSYQIKRNVSMLAAIVLVVCFCKILFNEATLTKTSIKEYSEPLPFATIKDFAGENASGYEYTAKGFLEGQIDVICEKNDLIAPRYIEYNEHAKVTGADGKTINGILYVHYCEVRAPWMAKLIAKEMYRYEKLRFFKYTQKTEPLDLDADSVICFTGAAHAPTIILQKGTTVIKAMFAQTSSNYQMPFEEWAAIVLKSIA